VTPANRKEDAMSTKTYPTGGEFLLQPTDPADVFTPEDFDETQRMIAQTVEDFVERHIAPVREQLEYEGDTGLGAGLLKQAGEMGLLMADVPEAYGGMGSDKATIMLISEKIAASGSFAVTHGAQSGIGTLPIVYFGTPEQKQEYLPKMLSGEHYWCQGYSEPGSGSDLASLKTKAVLDGDEYVVTGAKIWTTYAQYADWSFCLVRTNTEVKKQDGISFLLIDMKTPGITVRPLVLLDEGHEVNEVFFDDGKVPLENLVYEENKGWTVAKYLLGHERMNTGRIGASKRELGKLKEFAAAQIKDGRPLIEDARFRDRLSRVEVELMALEITNLRFLDQLRSGHAPGAEVSMLKIKGTEIQQMITELMMHAAGPRAQPMTPLGRDTGAQLDAHFDTFVASLAPRYCNYRKTSIYAGSNEIQRNIIAKMTLGL